ncbi:MAG: hypothetical protein KC591_05090 [Gemmatimonadetes bacterium]|nr:hypothetical protein [Gemmatimonadota bacterium]
MRLGDHDRADGNPRDEALDPGIRRAVRVLQFAGVETFESCEGGEGHAFHQPTIRFHGGAPAGYRAVSAALEHGLRVDALRRYWTVIDGELTGPFWELTLHADGSTT